VRELSVSESDRMADIPSAADSAKGASSAVPVTAGDCDSSGLDDVIHDIKCPMPKKRNSIVKVKVIEIPRVLKQNDVYGIFTASEGCIGVRQFKPKFASGTGLMDHVTRESRSILNRGLGEGRNPFLSVETPAGELVAAATNIPAAAAGETKSTDEDKKGDNTGTSASVGPLPTIMAMVIKIRVCQPFIILYIVCLLA
jgi:hypothetical protein